MFWWILLAFVAGGFCGFCVAAICAAAGRADDALGIRDE